MPESFADVFPRRCAHVTHALLEARSVSGGPCTAREVMEYDADAITVDDTEQALTAAEKHGLVERHGDLWVPTGAALDHRDDFEDRYFQDI